ncbi:hypothetical protein pipiens_001553 [Culex pipiens pipiens]|uniref:Odorant receptor n=1 Tax=Culex pipiens pipiens TaxID=38569 RepID=A0ABD1CL67_CULPP
MYQLLRICFFLPIDIDAFMAVFNMGFIWTVALSRGICFAIYRRELNQLKKYVNARSCQRDNPVAKEFRKNTYRQNLKLATIFQLYTVINVSIWCFTEFRTNDNFDIPLPMHLLNDKLRLSIEFFYIHHKQLKAASSTNFLIVFSSAMVLISMNMFLFIIDPSVKRIPLLVVSCQFAFEVFICCYLFDSLEQENNHIKHHVYAIDWMTRRDNDLQRRRFRSIRQNALFLQLQTNAGLKIRAGGMFDLNLVSFSTLINLVYSMLTFLLRTRQVEF